MKFAPGDEVVIVGDTLNYGLPLNEAAVVMHVHMNLLDFRNYLIRIPKRKMDCWVPGKDIEDASEVNTRQAALAMKDYLINVSLETRDKELFSKVSRPDLEW